jgi:transcriptional regulator with XRE-family HTH domain
MRQLKALRKASGLRQWEAANRAGLDRTRLSLAENGHVKLSDDEERRLRRVFVKAIQKRAQHLEGVLAKESVSVPESIEVSR